MDDDVSARGLRVTIDGVEVGQVWEDDDVPGRKLRVIIISEKNSGYWWVDALEERKGALVFYALPLESLKKFYTLVEG
jgi:hypothetical protein